MTREADQRLGSMSAHLGRHTASSEGIPILSHVLNGGGFLMLVIYQRRKGRYLDLGCSLISEQPKNSLLTDFYLILLSEADRNKSSGQKAGR